MHPSFCDTCRLCIIYIHCCEARFSFALVIRRLANLFWIPNSSRTLFHSQKTVIFLERIQTFSGGLSLLFFCRAAPKGGSHTSCFWKSLISPSGTWTCSYVLYRTMKTQLIARPPCLLTLGVPLCFYHYHKWLKSTVYQTTVRLSQFLIIAKVNVSFHYEHREKKISDFVIGNNSTKIIDNSICFRYAPVPVTWDWRIHNLLSSFHTNSYFNWSSVQNGIIKQDSPK